MQQRIWVVLLMIASAVGVGAMTWYAWPYITNISGGITESTPTVKNSSSYKTYTDPAGRFHFSYPKSWKATECDESGVYLMTSGKNPCAIGEASLSILEKPLLELTYAQMIEGETALLKATVTTLTVDGVTATRLKGKIPAGLSLDGSTEDTPVDEVLLKKGDTVYSIQNVMKNQEAAFKYILSTLKFTTVSTNTNSATNTNSTNTSTAVPSDWKSYKNSKYQYTFQHPKTLTLTAVSPEYLTGMYIPSGNYRGYEDGLQELSVTVFDHRHGQSLIVGQYDAIREPQSLTIAGRVAQWGVTEVNNESSGAKMVISQLQYFGKEQDMVLRLTEDGTLTPIIAERLFKSLVVADTPSTTELYALSCDGMTFTTNTTLTKASWWKKFSSQIIPGWTLDQACYNSALNQVVYEKSRTDSTGNGGALIGVYSISTDTFVKATPRRAIYGGECAGDMAWDISSGVITYRCGSGDAGAYWYGVYTFNPVTEVNSKIKECSGDAETKKEICS